MYLLYCNTHSFSTIFTATTDGPQYCLTENSGMPREKPLPWRVLTACSSPVQGTNNEVRNAALANDLIEHAIIVIPLLSQ